MRHLKLIAITGALLTPLAAHAEDACTALQHQTLPHGQITRAAEQPAQTRTVRRQPAELPAHCLVQGAFNQRIGVGGVPYAIGFELRLPDAWNGRFLFQGGGGTDGQVIPAFGAQNDGPPALSRGFAVVSTDAGHDGLDASFGRDQQARLDYAYNALGEVTTLAKRLTTAFYGREPQYSYFTGCSNGGRQGMMAAQRFPMLFDGIVAGDPGFRLSRAAIGEMWDSHTLAAIAPHGDLSAALTNDDLGLIRAGVLHACDAADGLADGMINDTRACHFDPAILQCQTGRTSQCLTPAKVSALRTLFAGAHDSHGNRLYASWPYDAGIAAPGWRMWKLGDGDTPAFNNTLGLNSERLYFSTPPQPGITAATYDFDQAETRSAATGAINDPTSTFLTSFAQHGGKLLLYQGMSDPVFSANDLIAWYDQLTQDQGAPQAYARLFLIPGMTHCVGGPATDRLDPLTALQNWVEHGQAPDRIIATRSEPPVITRPLCAYPTVARYTGGNQANAASFVCRP